MTKKEYQLEIYKKLEKSQGYEYASSHFACIFMRIFLDMAKKYGPDLQEWELLEEEDILKYINNDELWTLEMLCSAC